jgi:hypothetical protein
MAQPQEVLAALDILWNCKSIRSDYELRVLESRRQSAGIPKVASYFGKLRERPSMLEAKQYFEREFYEATEEALNQAERVRKGSSAEAAFKPNAKVFFAGSGKYGVEIFLKRDVSPLVVNGFGGHNEAVRWLRDKGAAYAETHGAPAGIRLIELE